MKVLITSDWYAPVINGVVTSVLLLKRELQRRGHEVRVVTLSPTLHSYQEGDVYYIGSVRAGKIYPGARLKLNRSRSLIGELTRWHPDIIHSQCEFSTFRVAYALSERLNIPIVHTYHTIYEDYTHYLALNRRVGRQIVSTFSRWIGRKTACLVAPTEKVKRLLRSYHITGRIEVIPTGIDLSAYQTEPAPGALDGLRRKWGIPDDKIILLYLGRLAKEKNLDVLINQIAAANRQECFFLLVGDGPSRSEILAHVQRRGLSYLYTGMIPHEEAPLYYRLGDLFVTASTSETQGLTYFEALAAGVPVLCRKDPCVEGVIEDGCSGWQYETQEEFCRCLAGFCSDLSLRQKMSRMAADTAQRFSGEAFAAAVETLYMALLSS